jgi:hypothetical protein
MPKTLSVGEPVKVPWGLDWVVGIVKEVYGPPGHQMALVAIPVRGAQGEALTEEVVSYPVEALELVEDSEDQ